MNEPWGDKYQLTVFFAIIMACYKKENGRGNEHEK